MFYLQIDARIGYTVGTRICILLFLSLYELFENLHFFFSNLRSTSLCVMSKPSGPPNILLRMVFVVKIGSTVLLK